MAAPVERPRGEQVSSGKPIDTQLPVRQEIGQQRGDPFATLTWTPAAPKPSAAANQPPPKPQPPANPYKFAGIVHHDGVRKVFLIFGERVIEVKPGELLEQGFRVKAVTDSAVTLVYEQIPDQPVTIATVFADPAASTAAAGETAPRPAPQNPPKQ